MSGGEEFDDWAIEETELWLGSFGGFEALRTRAHLATPTEDDFPIDPDHDVADIASDYLAFAQVHARLEHVRFEMVPVASFDAVSAVRGKPERRSATRRGRAPERVADREGVTIPYDPSDVHDPAAIVAEIACGMSRYQLQHALIDAPREVEQREYVVDHGAVFLGFGIFLANAAFRFDGGSRGVWGYRRRGALTEHDVSTVLALFAVLLEIPEQDVAAHLAENPKEYFRLARARLLETRRSALDDLRDVKGRTRGPFR